MEDAAARCNPKTLSSPQEQPPQYVISCAKAFGELGVELTFKGKGKNEIGVVSETSPEYPFLTAGREVVAVDPHYFRPTEVDLLIGDPRKAKEKLGWEPSYNIDALVKEMVQHDLELFKRDQTLREAGFKVKNEFE